MARRPRQSGQPSLEDVAALAGVSGQTVSRVINNTAYVMPATREKVLRAVAELGYRTNAAARALATGRFGSVGVVCFDLTAVGNLFIIDEAIRLAQQNRYAATVITVSSATDADLQAALRGLADQAVDGMLVVEGRTKPLTHEEAREAFAQALFLKDIHYLTTDLWNANHLKDTPYYNDTVHHEATTRGAIGQTVGQVLSNASTLDGSINPDGGIPKSAMPQFEAWVTATRQRMGPTNRYQTNADILRAIKDGRPGARWAKQVNARIYQSFRGYLSRQKPKTDRATGEVYERDIYWRPDWAKLILSHAMANTYRNLRKFAADGHYPLSLYVDAATYASDQADPEQAKPGAMKLGQAGGCWTAEGTVPMGDVVQQLRDGISAHKAMDRWVKQQEEEGNRG